MEFALLEIDSSSCILDRKNSFRFLSKVLVEKNGRSKLLSVLQVLVTGVV